MGVVSNNNNFSVRMTRKHEPDNTTKPFLFPSVRQEGISIGNYPEGTHFQRHISFDAEGNTIIRTERVNPDGTITVL